MVEEMKYRQLRVIDGMRYLVPTETVQVFSGI